MQGRQDANHSKELQQYQTAFYLQVCPLSVKAQMSFTHITTITTRSKQFHGSRRKVNSFQTNPLADIFINISPVYMPVKRYLRKNMYIRVTKVLMRLRHIQAHFYLFCGDAGEDRKCSVKQDRWHCFQKHQGSKKMPS